MWKMLCKIMQFRMILKYNVTSVQVALLGTRGLITENTDCSKTCMKGTKQIVLVRNKLRWVPTSAGRKERE